MKLMAFDLSSACIGTLAAEVYKPDVIKRVMSAPIIPPAFDPVTLGYMHSKKKLPSGRDGVLLNTYWRSGETSISEAIKERRDVEVRNEKNRFVKDDIGRQIHSLIKGVNPNILLAEKNEIFGGVLTSVLLGEIMGILEGVASTYGIPLFQYKVQQVREQHHVSQLVVEFTRDKSAEYLLSLPDVSKAALREKMEKKYGVYGFHPQTDDEGDACIVFDYWFEKVFKEGKK